MDEGPEAEKVCYTCDLPHFHAIETLCWSHEDTVLSGRASAQVDEIETELCGEYSFLFPRLSGYQRSYCLQIVR